MSDRQLDQLQQDIRAEEAAADDYQDLLRQRDELQAEVERLNRAGENLDNAYQTQVRQNQLLADEVTSLKSWQESVLDALGEFRAYAAGEIQRGGAHHDPIWAKVADILEQRQPAPKSGESHPSDNCDHTDPYFDADLNILSCGDCGIAIEDFGIVESNDVVSDKKPGEQL